MRKIFLSMFIVMLSITVNAQSTVNQGGPYVAPKVKTFYGILHGGDTEQNPSAGTKKTTFECTTDPSKVCLVIVLSPKPAYQNVDINNLPQGMYSESIGTFRAETENGNPYVEGNLVGHYNMPSPNNPSNQRRLEFYTTPIQNQPTTTP